MKKATKMGLAIVAYAAIACRGEDRLPPPRSVAPEGDRHAFRWDFSKAGTRSYAFSQTMSNRSLLRSSEHTARAEASGFVDIVSSGDGKAKLVLRDIELRPDGSQQPHSMPTVVIPDVREDGSVAGIGDPRSALMALLMPLPPKPLAIGEVQELPLQVPVNAQGSPLTLQGTAKVRLTGFAQVDGQRCGVLSAVIDISKLEVPKELSGSYQASIKGTATVHFDPLQHSLVRTEVAIVMSMKTAIPEGDGSTERMEMVSDNLMKLSSQKVAPRPIP